MNRIKEALGEKGIKQTWLAEKSIVFLQALYKIARFLLLPVFLGFFFRYF
jgi:hypothetical protein